jgi:long-chain acyl-CoA synthetase
MIMKNVPLYEVRKIIDLRDMLKQSTAIYGEKAAFLVKDPRAARQAAEGAPAAEGAGERSLPYLPVSYKQYDRDVDALGTRFRQLGLGSARVAILAETRYEWYVTYLATVNGVGVIVPLDKELPQVEIESLLNRSHADILVYAKSKKKEVDAIRGSIPSVKYFVCMDETSDGDVYFWDWLEAGELALAAGDKGFTEAVIDPEILSILLFTSGTTAKSKAVMLSHRNICINLQAMCSMLYIGPDDIFLSVLPLHHTYECTCGFLCPIYRGCTVAMCEGLRHITKNMQESKVTIILVVPLMVELFYKRIIKAATADPKLAKKFKLGLKISGALRKIGIDKRRHLFERIHQNFGGHLRLIIAGGAAIDPAIIKGMQDLGLHTLQGYGLTECAPILALNRDVIYNNRAAGLPLPGVEVKIIDKDENGIGEILGRGPNVMLGYYENEEATREAIDEEGFFHTGDLGYLDKDNFVIITGRKKNVIITKNGKNIFPEEIEFLLARTGYVQESLVSGMVDNEGETRVTAEIFPNMEKIQEQTGESDPKSEVVRRLIADEVRKVNHSLATYKYIKSFTLRDTEFEKTTSKKIKRKY